MAVDISFSIQQNILDKMAASMSSTFRRAVEGIFNSWTALRIAVQQGFGGAESTDKARWMVDAAVQWINENSNVEQEDIEDCLADILNTEFDLVLEDDSLQQVSRDIHECLMLCQQGKDVSRFYNLPMVPMDQLVRSPPGGGAQGGGGSSSSDTDGSEEEGEESMQLQSAGPSSRNTQISQNVNSAASNAPSHTESLPSDSQSTEQSTAMEEGEEEWTVVKHKKR